MDALLTLFEGDFEKKIVHFKTTMQRCYALLKDITFININSSRKRINKNLFDAFSYAIAQLSEDGYQRLLGQVELFNEKYRKLFEEDGFLSETKLKQNSKRAVIDRFQKMEKFIKQFI